MSTLLFIDFFKDKSKLLRIGKSTLSILSEGLLKSNFAFVHLIRLAHKLERNNFLHYIAKFYKGIEILLLFLIKLETEALSTDDKIFMALIDSLLDSEPTKDLAEFIKRGAVLLYLFHLTSVVPALKKKLVVSKCFQAFLKDCSVKKYSIHTTINAKVDKLETIGTGEHGTVYKVLLQDKPVALKSNIKKEKESSFFRQIALMTYVLNNILLIFVE
jgi:hypothetical protein